MTITLAHPATPNVEMAVRSGPHPDGDGYAALVDMIALGGLWTTIAHDPHDGYYEAICDAHSIVRKALAAGWDYR